MINETEGQSLTRYSQQTVAKFKVHLVLSLLFYVNKFLIGTYLFFFSFEVLVNYVFVPRSISSQNKYLSWSILYLYFPVGKYGGVLPPLEVIWF